MVDLSFIPNVSLKGIFFIHFILSAWALQSIWSPTSYLYYNLVFLLTLMWSMHIKESEEPIGMAINVNLACVLLDVFIILFYFADAYRLGEGFTFIMAFLNLLFRPISIILLYRISTERNPLTDPLPSHISHIFNQSGIAVSGTMPSPYQDIDNMPHQSVPRNNFSPTVYHT